MKKMNVRSSKVTTSLLGVLFMFSLAVALIPLQSYAATLTRQLQVGMRGSDVSALQTFLASDPAIYPQGLVTGYYGVLTRAAVVKFQLKNEIPPVGRVGPLTLAAINAQMSGGMTSGSDQSAPLISNVGVNPGNNSVVIGWITNESAAALVYYSTSPLVVTEGSGSSAVTISGTSLVVHTDLRTAHSATITGLQSATTYYYVIYVKDGSGNESVTSQASFKTN